MKRVHIECKGGNVTITTSGFVGKECQQATAELEKKLGKVTSDTPTAEAQRQGQVDRVVQR